jgi:hypothetical protein
MTLRERLQDECYEGCDDTCPALESLVKGARIALEMALEMYSQCEYDDDGNPRENFVIDVADVRALLASLTNPREGG